MWMLLLLLLLLEILPAEKIPIDPTAVVDPTAAIESTEPTVPPPLSLRAMMETFVTT